MLSQTPQLECQALRRYLEIHRESQTRLNAEMSFRPASGPLPPEVHLNLKQPESSKAAWGTQWFPFCALAQAWQTHAHKQQTDALHHTTMQV